MRTVLRVVGRVALVVILLASAWMHLTNPDSFTPLYEKVYPVVHGVALQNSVTFLPQPAVIKPYYKLMAKVIGLFEGTSGLLIFFGEGLGAVMYLGSLLLGLFSHYGPELLYVAKWTRQQHLQLNNIVLFVGLAICIYAYQKKVAAEKKS